MASAREIQKRITSFGKTKQITKTMELVATSRMKKTQDRLNATKPYAEKDATKAAIFKPNQWTPYRSPFHKFMVIVLGTLTILLVGLGCGALARVFRQAS